MSQVSPVRSVLSGPSAFYAQPDYKRTTKQELASKRPLNSTSYTFETESKTARAAKKILSVIIFPIGIYRLAHSLIAKIVLPASGSKGATHFQKLRENFDLNGKWKLKRLSIKVDGFVIDALIVGKSSTLNNGRWALYSNGNDEGYEEVLNFNKNYVDHTFTEILTQIKGNGLIFNYPGVGANKGAMPSRSAMSKAYRAMLSFLEDQDKGIGAKEIIGYGHSIGGGVQGDALRKHQLKDGIKYVFVKSVTFSDLSSAAASITNRVLGFFIKVFGWNMGSVESSKKLKAPEIIMQTAQVKNYTDLKGHPDWVVDDGVISANASLAKKLLEDDACPKKNKFFMGRPEGHNRMLRDPSFLSKKIIEML